jgi:hypothetical protein
MRISIFLTLILLASCGGGGGGEGSGPTPGTSALTGVRLIHTAIDLPPVIVASSGKEGSSPPVRFNERALYSGLPIGEQNLTIRPLGGDGVESFTFPVSVSPRKRFSVLVFGTRETFGINAKLFEDTLPEIPDGSAAVRVVHGLSGASVLSGAVGGVAFEAPFGDATEYLIVPAGEVAVSARRAADGRVAVSGVRTVANRRAYTLVIAGELGYLALTNLLED